MTRQGGLKGEVERRGVGEVGVASGVNGGLIHSPRGDISAVLSARGLAVFIKIYL